MAILTSSRTQISSARLRIENVRRLLSTYREPERPPGSGKNIHFESLGGTRVYTLDRPEALNALSWDMFLTLSRKADEWREDPTVKLVLGLGEGRAFAAGGDIKAVVDSARNNKPIDAVTMVTDSFRMNWKMANLGKPYAAFMDGIVMGGGAGLALPADIRIATPRTMYAMPEQRIGFSPDFGGSYFMNQLDGQIGTWLALTGRDVFGREAFELGIASHYVAEEAVPELKARLSKLDSPTADEISTIVSEYHVPASEGLASKQNPNGSTPIKGEIRAFLDRTFSLPSLSAIYKALKEEEVSGSPQVRAWAAEQRKMMDTRGPTGMAVAVENYHSAGKAKRYATTVEQDSLMCTGFTGGFRATNDLIVGAVHSLFDKKKTPIPFDPPITDLDNPFLQPEAIKANFFRRDSPYLVDCPPKDVGDGLHPRPKEKVGPDANWGKFRRYGVPSEEMVKGAVGEGASPDEVVSSLVWKEKGARRDELEAVVRRILKEHTTGAPHGLVKWMV